MERERNAEAAFPALYAAEGLPAAPPLAPGKQHMLAAWALTYYAADLQRSHRRRQGTRAAREPHPNAATDLDSFPIVLQL